MQRYKACDMNMSLGPDTHALIALKHFFIATKAFQCCARYTFSEAVHSSSPSTYFWCVLCNADPNPGASWRSPPVAGSLGCSFHATKCLKQ